MQGKGKEVCNGDRMHSSSLCLCGGPYAGQVERASWIRNSMHSSDLRQGGNGVYGGQKQGDVALLCLPHPCCPIQTLLAHLNPDALPTPPAHLDPARPILHPAAPSNPAAYLNPDAHCNPCCPILFPLPRLKSAAPSLPCCPI